MESACNKLKTQKVRKCEKQKKCE